MAEMKKMGYKDAFYSRLQADYNEHEMNSFISRYIKKEKEKSFQLLLEQRETVRTEHPTGRKDSYILLLERFYDLKEGNIEEKDYLTTFLNVLIGNAKIHFESEQNTVGYLLEYGKRIGGEAVFSGERSNKKKYEKVLQLLENDQEILFGMEKVEQIHEELLGHLLRLDVQTFLYDVGYPVTLKQKEAGSYKSRKKDKTMDMLDAYCEENDIYFGTQSSEKKVQASEQLSKEKKAYCREIYEKLKGDGLKNGTKRYLVLPIQIDPVTGAGIYLMGSGYFPNYIWKKNRYQEDYCYACFYWNDLGPDAENMGMGFQWISDDSDWKGSHYKSLDEALRWYYGYVKREASEFYADRNGSLWEKYRKEFLEEDWKEYDLSVTKEEIEKSKEEFNMMKEENRQ